MTAKFKGKLTRGLKNHIRNFVNFHVSCQSHICNLMGFFRPKHIKIWMKEYRRVMSHDSEE